MKSLKECVDIALTFYKENNLPIPNNVLEYIANYPKGLSRQVIKKNYNLTTAEFVKLLNPLYSPPKSAEERVKLEAVRLGYHILTDTNTLSNNTDKVLLECTSCGYKHTTTIASMTHSILGCPRCKSGNLPWTKRREELETLLLDKFNAILVSDVPINQSGTITVKHLDCNTEYSTTLVGIVHPTTKNRGSCPNCRNTDTRVTYAGITFGSQFEYECYLSIKHLNPELHVPYSKYLNTNRLWVCDFKIGNYWIEVSNFKQDFKGYFSNIEGKRALVESNDDYIFLFVTSTKELSELITLM